MSSAVRYIIIFPIFVLIILIVLLFSRAFLIIKPPRVHECNPYENDFVKADNGVVERFRNAIRCKTISFGRHQGSPKELLQLQDLIFSEFPTIHNSSFVDTQVINNYSLLYTVTGSNKLLKPYMLAAHLDVVPVNEDTWSVTPFDGVVKDGFIYGRGTIDDKHCVMGILESLEFLLKKGFRPKRTIYIAFGHDEEVSGYDGARKITDLLSAQGVQLDFVLDEGLFLLDGVLPGLSQPVALIGVTEKGYLTVELSVEGVAGHSSVPPPETAIGILARALTRLQAHPHPNKFGKGPEWAMFESLAPYANPFYRLVYSNLWLFSKPISWVLSRKPSQNALVRTTTAITMVKGGIKENVIPSYASATVNHRIHPSETVLEVLEYNRKVIDDNRVHIKALSELDPHPTSRYDHEAFGFMMIKQSIREIFQGAVVAPGVMVANTDSRWYSNLTTNVYRFSPAYLFPNDLSRFHGDDERISVENYEKVINFYVHLLKNCDEETLKLPISPHQEL